MKGLGRHTKSAPQPRSRKTASGGKITAMLYGTIELDVIAKLD